MTERGSAWGRRSTELGESNGLPTAKHARLTLRDDFHDRPVRQLIHPQASSWNCGCVSSFAIVGNRRW